MNLKDIKLSLLEEFSSIRLAITLLVFMVITTLIGTVLPQEPMVGTQGVIQKYGVENYRLFKSLGLTDVFHSWWYLALLTTFGINLTVASFWRVFPKWKIAFMWPQKIKGETISKLPVCSEINNDEIKLENLKQSLEEKKYKTKLEDGFLVAMKGGWHRLGASVTHIGIMILLVGSTFSILTGFNGMVQLSEDEGFYVADLGQSTNQIMAAEEGSWLAPITKMPVWFGRLPRYLVKVNKTWRVDYENGKPKQWFTDLSVLDDEKNELHRKTIHVNDPLQYRGLDVYQSNWGRFTEVSFNNESVTLPVENINGEEVVYLPLSNDIGLKLKVLKQPDKNAQLKPDTLEVYSVLVKDQNKFDEKLIGTVEKNNKLNVGPINITYLGTQTLTGLQFKSNPGDLMIYPGLIFMMLGVLIAFGSKKQIWATYSPSNKILIGGKSDRAPSDFLNEFEKFIAEVNSKGKVS